MYSISIYPDENHIVVTMTGIVSLEKAIETLQAVHEHPGFNPKLQRLYDFSEAIVNWGVEDINALIHSIKTKLGNSQPNLKIAFVNSDSTEKALLSLFTSLAKTNLERNYGVFNTLAEAKEWITKS